MCYNSVIIDETLLRSNHKENNYWKTNKKNSQYQ
jgi:hypothetical protein